MQNLPNFDTRFCTIYKDQQRSDTTDKYTKTYFITCHSSIFQKARLLAEIQAEFSKAHRAKSSTLAPFWNDCANQSIEPKSRYYKERNVQSKKRQAIRRWFVSIRHGRHVLSQCPKQRHSPPGISKHFLIFPGGDCLCLGHWLRTWRPWRMLTNHQRIAWRFFLLIEL